MRAQPYTAWLPFCSIASNGTNHCPVCFPICRSSSNLYIEHTIKNIARISLASLLLFLLLCISAGDAQPRAQHVVLVIIDGARYTETLGDSTGAYIPRMKQLAAQGSMVQTFINDSITVTQRAIPAIWCGSWSAPHDTVVNGLSNQYATVPTVWEYLRKDLDVDSTQAMYICQNISAPWIQSYHAPYGPSYWPWYILQGSSDLDVWQNARAKLQSYHPILTVLYLENVDGAGHSGIWSKYTRAITIADSIVGMLWDFLQADSIYQNATTVLVTNDHGRHTTNFSGHGDGCWGCRHIMLAAFGSAVKQHFQSSAHHAIPDITPTIGGILNFSTPFSSGASMSELLTPIYYREPVSLNFGHVPLDSSRIDSVLVYNSGGVPLLITSIVPSDTQITISPASSIIPPHSRNTFIVRYSQKRPEAITASLIISHNAAGSSDTVIVSGSVDSSLSSLIITSSVIGHGTISPMGAVTVALGARQSFAVAPDSGWHIDSLVVDGERVDSLTDYTFYNVATKHTITAYVTRNYFVRLQVNRRWNMVSVPVLAGDYSKVGIFRSTTSLAYAYEGSYAVKDTLANGSGYWLKFGTGEDVDIPGSRIVAETVTVRRGWNMIGSISTPISAYSITGDSAGMVTSNLYGYSARYMITDTLVPGRGYWIKVTRDGRLFLDTIETLAKKANLIRRLLNDTPPPPPDGEAESVQNGDVPTEYALGQNYPNPFNPTTTLRYDLPQQSYVTLKIYNVLGQVVQTVVDGTASAGYKTVAWNASNLASGVYFYCFEATSVSNPTKSFTQVKKMLLLK